jgi:hypothetical protein
MQVGGNDNYRIARLLAGVLCAAFTLVGLIFPPSLSHDAGWGMQEWRTLVSGGPLDTIFSAQQLFHAGRTLNPNEPVDITRDQPIPVTWWSPGQYLIPGSLTLGGIPLGMGLAIVTGISLLACLLGWIQVVKYFGFSPRLAIMVVALMATFRYSMLPFGIYNGGEILLQGITPWLILLGCRVPTLSPLKAAGLACLGVSCAFFLKLTGIMVVSTALLAGSVEGIVRLRRITAGMIAGAVGAMIAFISLYFTWFSRGANPASGTGLSFRLGDILFALGTPWGAGISWGDMLQAFLRRSALGANSENHPSSVFLWCLLPVVIVFVTALAKGWSLRTAEPDLQRLIIITMLFYAVSALLMIAIYSRGGDVSFEERHLRAAGMLIFICAMASVACLPRKSIIGLAVGFLSVLMSLYGVFSLASRTRASKKGTIDSVTRTQQEVDKGAMEFVRSAYAREGRSALFFTPSAQIACAFPRGARILTNLAESESENPVVKRTYTGRVSGGVYVILPAQIADSERATEELKAFVDYPLNGWSRYSFGLSTVLVQEGQSH